ncbi:MAG: hypothetical protein NZ937_00745 [Armatimonadetes bacterium]|nr:hypothetical protein [Armatimonadota bacterium]
MRRRVCLGVVALWTLSLTFLSSAQQDIFFKDIGKALKEPRPAIEFLAQTPMFVIANDETLFNLFRTYLPPFHIAEFVPLKELPLRINELTTAGRSIVVLIDRARSDLAVEHSQIVPFDLKLIRHRDVVIASEAVQDLRGIYYRIFFSAPSYSGLKQAIEEFSRRLVRAPIDMKFQEVIPVPIFVVITNAGQEIIHAFEERVSFNFVWTTPENLSQVQDLLLTETEIYLLIPPVPSLVRERIPFNLNLLAPNQSVAVRRTKGGNYWQVLFYGSFPKALEGLIRRYPDILSVPQEPVVITHPVIGSVKKLLVVPFGDIAYYRNQVGNFAAQVYRAFQNAGFSAETVMPIKPLDPFRDWSPFQDGNIEPQLIAKLAKINEANLVLSGRLVDFDTQTVRQQVLSRKRTASTDKAILEVLTIRVESVTAKLQAWLYDGQTGEVIWRKVVTGKAIKEIVEDTRKFEEGLISSLNNGVEPFVLQVSTSVNDEKLFSSAATSAISEILNAMREEIQWLAPFALPTPVTVPFVPEAVVGLVGRVETEKDALFVYIDIGQNQGIKVGDTFRIHREIIVETERKVVRLEEDIGEAVVAIVYPEACKARVVLGADAVIRWKDEPLRARLIKIPEKSPTEQKKETKPESKK